MRERLKEPSLEMQELIYKPFLVEHLKMYFEPMLNVNKAHVLMLLNQKIIKHNDGKAILSNLMEMEVKGPDAIKLDPAFEDIYFNFEKKLIESVGYEIGGQIHTGRSRNDLYSTISRMWIREKLFEIYNIIIKLRLAVLNLAEKYIDTVMTGYTHFQPAQPITFGYYLTALGQAMERNYIRLYQAFDRVNLSPLGAGALATTSFPIDRQETANYLGFDGIVVNALDAVASRDYVIELLSGLAIFMTLLSRFAHDLYIWVTDEFKFVELSDSISGSSSIMPQKKNPSIIEHIKSKASHAYGGLISALSVCKNVPFTNCRDVGKELFHFCNDVIQEAITCTKLCIVTLKGITINKTRMEETAKTNFCTVTDLADMLVRNCKVSFREAHMIVGASVKDVYEKGGNTGDLTSTILQEKANKLLQHEILIPEILLKQILDPKYCVDTKKVIGGTSPVMVKDMIDTQKGQIQRDKKELTNRKNKICKAIENMNKKINELIGCSEDVIH